MIPLLQCDNHSRWITRRITNHHTVTHSVVISDRGPVTSHCDQRLPRMQRHCCQRVAKARSDMAAAPKKARNPGNRIFKPIPQVNPWDFCLHNTISVQNIRKRPPPRRIGTLGSPRLRDLTLGVKIFEYEPKPCIKMPGTRSDGQPAGHPQSTSTCSAPEASVEGNSRLESSIRIIRIAFDKCMRCIFSIVGDLA
jgi:hypothetical protein